MCLKLSAFPGAIQKSGGGKLELYKVAPRRENDDDGDVFDLDD